MSNSKGRDYYNNLLVQQALKRIHNLYREEEDGIWGKNTEDAFNTFAWYEQQKENKEKEKTVIVEPKKEVITTVKRKLAKGSMQLFSPPADNVSALNNFYGLYGIKNQREPDLAWFTFPYPMRLYDTQQYLSRHRCHKKVKESLEAVLETARDMLGLDFIKEHNLDTYFGCYNPRAMRGNPNSISRHSYAVAIDINADQNQFQTPWKKDKIGQKGYANMPIEFIEIFEAFGWKSGATAWNKDAMHFQLTQ